MKTIIHLTTIMFFVVFVTVCGSQTSDNSATSMSFTPWTQTNGPEGALFGGIAYDAVRDYLYATTNVGTFVRYNYKWYQIGSFASSSISVAPNGVVFAVDKKLGTAYKYIPPSAGNAPTGTLEQVGTGGIGGIVKVSPSGEVYILSNNLYHLEGTNWVLVPGSVGGSSLEFVGTNIYIGSSNGIFKYDGSLWTQVNTSMSDPTNCTVIAYNPVNSLLYFGDPYTRLGIFSYNPSTGVILGPIAGTENSKFSAITATSSGDVFAIGAKAIYMNFVELPETRRANGAQGLGAQSLITYNTRVYATVGSHILQSAPPYTVWTIPNLTLNETGKPIVGTTVTALLKNPINNFIFAGTDDGEIFFTSNPDFGWDQLRYSKAIPVERGKITSFAHFYNAERGIERIFAGREEGGVYYSGGTGWDWGSFNEDPLDKVVNTLTVYPPYENTTVCSGQKQLGKVFAGTENGLFWSHCYDECDIPDADWGVIKDEDVFQRPIF
ncbi:MAG: hypothetical protein HYZ34_04940, partial [Ignavibacteriae bacterium]|nr:hypothetical protein [Ignavibacteriota bacterium]